MNFNMFNFIYNEQFKTLRYNSKEKHPLPFSCIQWIADIQPQKLKPNECRYMLDAWPPLLPSPPPLPLGLLGGW